MPVRVLGTSVGRLGTAGPTTVLHRRASSSIRQNMTPSKPWEKMTAIAAGNRKAGSASMTASISKAKGRPERPQAPMPTMAKKSSQLAASIAARRTTKVPGTLRVPSAITVDVPSARSIGNCVQPTVSASAPGSAGRSSVLRQHSKDCQSSRRKGLKTDWSALRPRHPSRQPRRLKDVAEAVPGSWP